MFVSRFLLSLRGNQKKILITDLPKDVLIYILSFLSSNQVAACRIVCRTFNKICKHILNKRFSYYCTTIPSMLRAVMRNNSVFPNEKEKEGNLQVLSAGLLLLRAVFGRYISTGCCCFYPGLILDYIATITLRATHKRSKWGSIDASMSCRKTIFNRSLYVLLKLIESAADHFDRKIEPLLPPPRTFVGTKILDLLASNSEIQVESKIGSFFQKIAQKFPEKEINGIAINRWLKQSRSDLIRQNCKWIFKRIQQHKIKELTSQTKFHCTEKKPSSNCVSPAISRDNSQIEHAEDNSIFLERANDNLVMRDPNYMNSVNHWTAPSLTNLSMNRSKNLKKTQLNINSRKHRKKVEHRKTDKTKEKQFGFMEENQFLNVSANNSGIQPGTTIKKLLANVEESFLHKSNEIFKRVKSKGSDHRCFSKCPYFDLSPSNERLSSGSSQKSGNGETNNSAPLNSNSKLRRRAESMTDIIKRYADATRNRKNENYYKGKSSATNILKKDCPSNMHSMKKTLKSQIIADLKNEILCQRDPFD